MENNETNTSRAKFDFNDCFTMDRLDKKIIYYTNTIMSWEQMGIIDYKLRDKFYNNIRLDLMEFLDENKL